MIRQRPWRKVVERVTEGAGSDVLLMECGHQIVATHRRWVPGRKRCCGCDFIAEERPEEP